jgi:hypothetical protein
MIVFLIVISVVGYLLLGMATVKIISLAEEDLFFDRSAPEYTLVGFLMLLWPMFAVAGVVIGFIMGLGWLGRQVIQ